MHPFRPAALGLLSICCGLAGAQQQSIERIPTRFVEDGKPVTLELVVLKPAGEGPFPTVVFNHGSVDHAAEARHTATYAGLARFFNERGWLVVFPQRRGRGQSDGRHAEGWDAEQGHYTCDPERSLDGLEHGIEDLAEVIAHVRARAGVDASRLLIGGHSKGAALSLSYAVRQPRFFIGVLNFAGGWVGKRCGTADEINAGVFRRAAAFPQPTLWLYGERDPVYRAGQPRKNFDAFVAAGGRGQFHLFSPQGLSSDHQLVRKPEAWQGTMTGFLDSLPP